MRTIAVFDFDGTLTSKDTLLEFIRFVFGTPKAIFGFLLYSPLMALMFLGLFNNSRCKELLLTHFFKGMKYNDFQRYGYEFATVANGLLRRDIHALLLKHLEEGADVYVISASVEEWVKPFCMGLGVKDVLATRMEVDSEGRLTGRYATANCHGQEKVNRLLQVEPDRDTYTLYAYGDSSGDKQIFDFADHGRKV